jgi:hypothetical protein
VALGPISIGGRAGPSSLGAGCKLGKVIEKKGITVRRECGRGETVLSLKLWRR